MRLHRIAVLFFLVALSAGRSMADVEWLSVTAAYRERIALPPDAVLEVELLDVSRADARSIRLSSLRFRMDRTPISVELPYDPALIDERMSYSLSARVLSGEKALFRTTSSNPVLTRGATQSADLLLIAAAVDGNGSTGATARQIAGVPWAATEIAGRALIAEDTPEIVFNSNGEFSAFGGCNRLRGRAEVSGTQIRFPDPIAATQMACAEPQMKLEADFLDALRETTAYTRNGGVMSFQNAAGVTVLRFGERPE
jgi:putative lipoprotein